jgi:hypothetical protein
MPDRVRTIDRVRERLNRAIESDPATQTAFPIPKTLEPTRDPSALHEIEDLDRVLDPDAPSDDDEVTARPHERIAEAPPADPHLPEEISPEMLALGTQGGGSFRQEEDVPALEERTDHQIADTAVVPQVVGESTITASRLADVLDDVVEGEVPIPAADEDAAEPEPPAPRKRRRPRPRT